MGATRLDLRDHGAEDRSVIDLLRNVVAAVLRFFAPHAAVAAENLLLRHQLIVLGRASPRPRLRRLDRSLIATLATQTHSLLEAVVVVRPATVLRWHRAAWRLWWRLRSRRRVGRPPIDAELRAVIRRMWQENRLWGENRIAGELAKLGWRVSPRRVAKYRPKHLERGRGQSCRTFLRNHASQVWACDFFTVVTVHFQPLYAFVVISLERRAIVHVGVTAHPDGRVGGAAHGRGCRRRAATLSAARPRQHLRRALECSTLWSRGAMPSLAAESANGERDLRAPGGHAPARLPRSRPRPQRAPRQAHLARVCPLLPRTTASQPAHPAAHGRALARSGTSSHIP